MELRNLDLNLVRTLDAILREGSVTGAARDLQVSQPAVSSSLRRLRTLFNDELLRRVGNRYVLTPLAVVLRERCAVALRDITWVFEARSEFDPSTEQREFKLMASDYAMAVVIESVTPLLRSRAPGVRVTFTALSESIVDSPETKIRGLDGVLVPHGHFTGLPHVDIWVDDYLCLVATSNDRVGATLTLDDLAQLPWAFTYVSPAKTPAEQHLQALGIVPRVEVVAESFLALPFAVAHTDRVALIHSRLAPRLTATGDVRALPCPFPTVPIVEALWWHPVHDADPAHAWFRTTLVEAFAGEGAGKPEV